MKENPSENSFFKIASNVTLKTEIQKSKKNFPPQLNHQKMI